MALPFSGGFRAGPFRTAVQARRAVLFFRRMSPKTIFQIGGRIGGFEVTVLKTSGRISGAEGRTATFVARKARQARAKRGEFEKPGMQALSSIYRRAGL